jgi:hypothetical protein
MTRNLGFTQPFSYDDIVNRCRLQINGQDRFDERYGDYFWKVQPYQHHSGGAFWPMRAQAIAQTPTTFTITGTISGDVLTVTAPTSGTNFIVEGALITAVSGKASVGNIAPGTIITAFGTGNGLGAAGGLTYNISEPGLGSFASEADNITVTLPNLNYAPHNNPINVYSFALQPEEHQPSGTCNFSRIDTTTLVFDSITASGIAKPTKSTPFNFRIYAVNYNIFRVMSGMGGLAYSN